MKLLFLVVFLIPFYVSADNIDDDSTFVLDPSSFLIACTQKNNVCTECEGVIYLDSYFGSQSVIATVLHKKETYQFVASVVTNKVTGKQMIMVNTTQMCKKFNIEINHERLKYIANNSNVLIRKL